MTFKSNRQQQHAHYCYDPSSSMKSGMLKVSSIMVSRPSSTSSSSSLAFSTPSPYLNPTRSLNRLSGSRESLSHSGVELEMLLGGPEPSLMPGRSMGFTSSLLPGRKG